MMPMRSVIARRIVSRRIRESMPADLGLGSPSASAARSTA